MTDSPPAAPQSCRPSHAHVGADDVLWIVSEKKARGDTATVDYVRQG